jgi:hypothetical protein
MNCYSEVKFIYNSSQWACYIYALNPTDEDTIQCLMSTPYVHTREWSLNELYFAYDSDGEHPFVDQEFRKIRVAELFRKLSEGR